MQDPPEADPEAHHRYITLSDWEGQGERSPSRRYGRLLNCLGRLSCLRPNWLLWRWVAGYRARSWQACPYGHAGPVGGGADVGDGRE